MTRALGILHDFDIAIRRADIPLLYKREFRGILADVLRALRSENPRLTLSPEAVGPFLAFAALDKPVGPIELGRAVDPDAIGARASTIGTHWLRPITAAQLARRVPAGRYELTTFGRAEAARLRAGRAA